MQVTPDIPSGAAARDLAPTDPRALLEEQREFRIEQLTQLHGLGTDAPPAGNDAGVFRSLDAGARAALREVQAALWRLDEGTYGRCTGCGGPVEPARLEILPQTALCLPCARPR